mgnify:FL=1
MAEKKFDEQQVQQGMIGSDPNVEVVEERKPTNVRIQKFLLLSARSMDIAKKDAKGRKTSEMEQAMQIFFLDGNQCIAKTGQPLLNGFAPVVSIFKKDLTPDIRALEDMQVFTPVFAKISGNENFIQLHGILSDDEVAAYRRILADLL